MPARSEARRPLRAVFFDLGETLVSEQRSWEAWADWLDVPRDELSAVMRAVIERGEHHRRIFEILRPGSDAATEEAKRAAAGARSPSSLRGTPLPGHRGKRTARPFRPAKR